MSIRFHTPGPWTVDYTDYNLRICAGDRPIAELNGSTEHIEVRRLDAALERILACVETINLFTENAKVVEQTRAAISKATGR
jgi:hypothetical protein